MAYETGVGVGIDYGKAISWYWVAAIGGSSDAVCNLGDMYENGRGIEKDYEVAKKLYGIASEHGSGLATCSLGDMYRLGEGVEKSPETAERYYRQSAEQGCPEAVEELRKMGKDVSMYGKEVRERTEAQRGRSKST
ncbi:hypothetical protein AUQ37_01425 [Candidatus Methanomethylophilus sp. 1R26]|uniref:tetratricopeptide repeat protein n=1 Tax=Candidatus Methanomethylophilus sp. 1R26 TaxID=1769296 RepID=UPI00073778F6|nr:tetratricopeptide repeat protein [Candidatus Methanomethylophilus sp. 1R26]KUE73605.1 hypothetical protein AUQ37_01425 [Candidatus Methanomethylophilus sp. 1R26]